MVRRRRHRGQPVDTCQQAGDPVTLGVVSAQRLDPQLTGAVVDTFGQQPGDCFLVGVEHSAFPDHRMHGDHRRQRTQRNDRRERVAQSPDRQIMRLGRPFHPGERRLQPDAIRKLQDQRPAGDVLEGDPGGVQPPVEGIQPGACDRLFDSGVQGEPRLQGRRNGLHFDRALFAKSAGRPAHVTPSIGRILATAEQTIDTLG